MSERTVRNHDAALPDEPGTDRTDGDAAVPAPDARPEPTDAASASAAASAPDARDEPIDAPTADAAVPDTTATGPDAPSGTAGAEQPVSDSPEAPGEAAPAESVDAPAAEAAEPSDPAATPTETDGAAAAVPDADASAEVPDAAEVRAKMPAEHAAGTASDADGGGAAVDPADTGELDALSAAMDADDGAEPRRHWLRYPGLVGALAIVAVVILVPCGGAVLFFGGAFANQGQYSSAPDACVALEHGQVDSRFGRNLIRAGATATGDDSSCSYQGGAAAGPAADVHLTLRRYGTKGPLSASRMAHAGLNDALTGETNGDHRTTIDGLAEEAVSVRTTNGMTVYARKSNLVVALTVTGDVPDLDTQTIAAARQVTATLR